MPEAYFSGRGSTREHGGVRQGSSARELVHLEAALGSRWSAIPLSPRRDARARSTPAPQCPSRTELQLLTVGTGSVMRPMLAPFLPCLVTPLRPWAWPHLPDAPLALASLSQNLLLTNLIQDPPRRASGSQPGLTAQSPCKMYLDSVLR